MWSSGIGTSFAISLKRDRFDGVFLRRGAIVGEREAFPFKCKGLAPVGFVCGKGFVELELPSLPLIHHLHRYALHRGPTTVSSCSQNVSPSFISKKTIIRSFLAKVSSIANLFEASIATRVNAIDKKRNVDQPRPRFFAHPSSDGDGRENSRGFPRV